jgi:hypothetical protein
MRHHKLMRHGDKRGRNAHGKLWADRDGGPRRSDGDGSGDGKLHGDCDRNRAIVLPMAEEQRNDLRGDDHGIYDTGNHNGGQWSNFPVCGDERLRYGDQQQRDAHGKFASVTSV